MEITLQLTQTPKEKPSDDILGFGTYFTDHMFLMDYDVKNGWHNARIEPFHALSLHPASTALHYGAEIFEGLKAYRRADGGVQLFRPMENVRRMNHSAARLCLPTINEQDMLQALTKFVEVEQDWTPHSQGTSLYIRPFMFGNDENLGVHAVHRAMFVIIASPSGSYYAEARATRNAAETMLHPPVQDKKRKTRDTARYCGWTVWNANTLKKLAR